MSPEVWSALFAGIAILVAVIAACYSASAARSSKTSANAAKEQATISDLEFRSKAPRLEAFFIGDRWWVQNAGHSTAFNVQIVCQPRTCQVEPQNLSTLPEGEKAWASLTDSAASHSISLSWTRTLEGGPNDKPVHKVVYEPPTA